MDGPKRPETFLELPGDAAVAVASPRADGARETWLEAPGASPAPPPDGEAAPAPGARRKARAGDRAEGSVRDAVSLAIVAA
ncbi:MAG: hypothetical protein U0325_31245, partial [Polyangiales bacterium]